MCLSTIFILLFSCIFTFWFKTFISLIDFYLFFCFFLLLSLCSCMFVLINVLLKSIWRNHRPIWRQGSQSATLSKSTRLERSSLWTDWAWTSTRTRSHLFLAITEPEKQPQCELHYLFLPCFAAWLNVHVISQGATNLTCTQCRLYCSSINSAVTAVKEWHRLRGHLSHDVSCCVDSGTYLIAV